MLLLLAEKLKRSEGQIYAHELPSIFPNAESYIVPGSIHISFVSPCNQNGLLTKAPLCTGDNDRDAIHQTINERTYYFLMKNLSQ